MLDTVTIVTPNAVPLNIRARWRNTLASCKALSSPFLTPEFASFMGQVRDDTKVIIARDTDGLVAVLALHIDVHGKARPVGAPVSDHQALIAEPGFDASLADILETAKVSFITFSALNDPDEMIKLDQSTPTFSHIIEMDGGADDYFAAQRVAHAKHFKKMRQRARNIERDFGKATFVFDSKDLADFECLLGWKHDQYARTGKCDVLDVPWIDALLRQTWQASGPVRAVLSMMKIDGRPAAAELGLVGQGTYHSWIAAYDPEFGKYSPGLMVMHEVIAAVPTLGAVRVDLGAGHDHYKKYYANSQIPLARGLVLGRGPAARQYRMWQTGIDLLERGLGEKVAQLPVRLASSLDFMAACYPHMPDRIRGIAGRIQNALPV